MRKAKLEKLLKRERKKSRRLEEELARLNTVLQDRVIPSLVRSTGHIQQTKEALISRDCHCN